MAATKSKVRTRDQIKPQPERVNASVLEGASQNKRRVSVILKTWKAERFGHVVRLRDEDDMLTDRYTFTDEDDATFTATFSPCEAHSVLYMGIIPGQV